MSASDGLLIQPVAARSRPVKTVSLAQKGQFGNGANQ
ncbi:hypothetical protein FHS85_001702 [Rhodoligotrophos appendicifer]